MHLKLRLGMCSFVDGPEDFSQRGRWWPIQTSRPGIPLLCPGAAESSRGPNRRPRQQWGGWLGRPITPLFPPDSWHPRHPTLLFQWNTALLHTMSPVKQKTAVENSSRLQFFSQVPLGFFRQGGASNKGTIISFNSFLETNMSPARHLIYHCHAMDLDGDKWCF